MKRQRQVFNADNGVTFAVQVPDDSIGCSGGSWCSNCWGKVAYCNERCSYCNLPFLGPFGIPQVEMWELMDNNQRMAVVNTVYRECPNGGRIQRAFVDYSLFALPCHAGGVLVYR